MAKLTASQRSEVGTRKVRHLREVGKIPGVIYGHKQDAVAITLEQHDLELAIQHGERMLEIDVDGKRENVLLKDVQYDTFGQHVLHVDLARVDLNERVQVTVPIVLRGTPAGAVDGGVLHQALAEASIQCVVTAIPEDLRASVAELNIGDALHLSDLLLPDGAELLDDPGVVVASVAVVAEEVPAEEEAAEEGAAQPEVIGEKAEEGEEAEGK